MPLAPPLAPPSYDPPRRAACPNVSNPLSLSLYRAGAPENQPSPQLARWCESHGRGSVLVWMSWNRPESVGPFPTSHETWMAHLSRGHTGPPQARLTRVRALTSLRGTTSPGVLVVQRPMA
jgi:hypothetical protein